MSGGLIFLSWSGNPSREIAFVFKRILDERFDGTTVFFSELIEPGSDPNSAMLQEGLRRADALVAVLTKQAAESPWVIWETASVWGRQGLLIPVFVDVHPGEVPGPLTHVVQGVKLFQRDRLDRSLARIAELVGAATPAALSDDEFDDLLVAAGMLPVALEGRRIVRLGHRRSATEHGEISVAAPIIANVPGAETIMSEIDSLIDAEFSDFEATDSEARKMGELSRHYADIRWTPTLASDRIVSLQFEADYGYPWRATGWQKSGGVVFDAVSGRRLTLDEDVFINSVPWREALEGAFEEAVKRQVGENASVNAFPDPLTFAVSISGVGLGTKRYDILPGIEGAPIVWIEHSRLDRFYRTSFVHLIGNAQ